MKRKIRRILLPVMILFLVVFGAVSAQASMWDFFGALPNTQAKAVKKNPKILFVGNSHTYMNNVPGMVKRLCEKNGISPQITTVVHGTYSLYDYAYPDKNDAEQVKLSKKLKLLLNNKKWDYVILQDRRYEGVTNTSRAKKAVQALRPLIKKSGAQMVFYLSWAPEKGHSDYSNGWASSPADYLSKKADLYYALADKYNAALAPSGIAFQRASTLFPELKLYSADKNHASVAGSYLSACVIYSTLFNKSPEGTAYYRALDGMSRAQSIQVCKKLQALAADVTVRGSSQDNARLRFSKSQVSVKSGSKTTLSYKIVSGNKSSRVVYWKSSDPKVASVSQSGKVTAHKAGKVTITARLSNNKTGSCTVVVKGSSGGTNANQLTLGSSQLLMYVGKTKTLQTSIDAKNLTFTSSNPKAVAVNAKGELTAKKAGKARITVTAKNGKKAFCDVTSIIPVKKIAFSNAKSGMKIKKGQTQKLSVTITPGNASVKTLKWSSNNTNVLQVSQTGKIKAVSKGTAVITAVTTDGTSRKIQIKIKVV
ncbi:Ig-like domain-containing protein [Marvinbryantia sp.]|uniref:Ig-like domain-containing protein n=1 Tax=Marvinbryantia sp. TaxID=2496532 RepID=UPI003A8DA518